MKFNMEGPQEHNAAQEENVAATTFQSIAGEAYAQLLELQEKLTYDKSLTDEQAEEIRLKIKNLAATIEGANQQALSNMKPFDKNDNVVDINDDIDMAA
ncbi:MAG: hypothetical protein RLY57_479 [Candidatus Parcubacteria bacterium]|jgi:hypothetical protein